MLKTKFVKIKWNGKIKSHYIFKGYIYTKMGDEFEVKVEDLTNGSHAKVNVECDGCGKLIKSVVWQNYLLFKKDNKYFCNKCSHQEEGWISFSKWCIDNNRNDILNLWDYELNNCLPSEISYGIAKKFYFKCPRGIHKSELIKLNSFSSKNKVNIKCKTCNSFAQWGINNLGEDFLNKYWDWEKNTVDPWEIDRGNNKKNIWIKCQEKEYHDSYEVSPNNFTGHNSRCPYCNNQKIHLLNSLGTLYPQVLEVWSDKNKESPYEYAPWGNQEVWWKCLDDIHEDFIRNIPGSHRANFGCPECTKERNESFLQEKVRLYLNELNYTILHEYKCTIIPINPKTKYKLPFDNEIKELKLIIEVHGIQHYEICGWHISLAKINNTTPGYELHKRKLYDKYKKMYAISQGYYYLEIPYWTDNKNKTWKNLIDDKINKQIIVN